MNRSILSVALAALGFTAATASATVAAPQVSITRLDCGRATIKDFDSFFSDTFEYPKGPRGITNSCYVIRHMDHVLLWDTGFDAAARGKPNDWGDLVATFDRSVVEQLASLRLKPADVDIVGISHMHGDHVGQVRDFPAAKLLIGKRDFELTKGDKDPFGPWRAPGAKTELMQGADIDVFGDGSVVALNLPGHTPGHMALLVRLESGPVLLTGDMYHSTMARDLKGIPPFNSSRAETLASIDRFERIAKSLGAKVIIQHEPADIAKLPPFPNAAQ